MSSLQTNEQKTIAPDLPNLPDNTDPPESLIKELAHKLWILDDLSRAIGRVGREEEPVDPVDDGSSPPPGFDFEIDEVEVEESLKEWRPCFGELNKMQEFELYALVKESERIKRCYREERRRDQFDAQRARKSWDSVRSLAVQAIASKLPRNPRRWHEQLRSTKHGCLWMIEEWEELLYILENEGRWDERQMGRALDLLGLPTAYRTTKTRLERVAEEGPEALRKFVQSEIDDLRHRIEHGLEAADAYERDTSIQGLRLTYDSDLKALRRYEAGCMRRYFELMKRLKPCLKKTSSSSSASPAQAPRKPAEAKSPQRQFAEQSLRNASKASAALAEIAPQMVAQPNTTERRSGFSKIDFAVGSPPPNAPAREPEAQAARSNPLSGSGNRHERRRAEAEERRRERR